MTAMFLSTLTVEGPDTTDTQNVLTHAVCKSVSTFCCKVMCA